MMLTGNIGAGDFCRTSRQGLCRTNWGFGNYGQVVFFGTAFVELDDKIVPSFADDDIHEFLLDQFEQGKK